MPEMTIAQQFANAIPVVLGGVVALSGGIVSQYLLHRLAESRERSKLRRERLEGLVRALFAHEQWIKDKQNKTIFRNEDHDAPAPLDEVRMIQALHFPELAREVYVVSEAYVPMLKFINEQRIARMTDEKAFIANWNPAPFDEAYKQHLQATSALTKKCRALLANDA